MGFVPQPVAQLAIEQNEKDTIDGLHTNFFSKNPSYQEFWGRLTQLNDAGSRLNIGSQFISTRKNSC